MSAEDFPLGRPALPPQSPSRMVLPGPPPDGILFPPLRPYREGENSAHTLNTIPLQPIRKNSITVKLKSKVKSIGKRILHERSEYINEANRYRIESELAEAIALPIPQHGAPRMVVHRRRSVPILRHTDIAAPAPTTFPFPEPGTPEIPPEGFQADLWVADYLGPRTRKPVPVPGPDSLRPPIPRKPLPAPRTHGTAPFTRAPVPRIALTPASPRPRPHTPPFPLGSPAATSPGLGPNAPAPNARLSPAEAHRERALRALEGDYPGRPRDSDPWGGDAHELSYLPDNPMYLGLTPEQSRVMTAHVLSGVPIARARMLALGEGEM
ncbi:hypothetical protein MBLNU459_g8123t3 [Dothideomycetes sp. NU459]